MYFPSLSIITTLACAALSVAAPLTEALTPLASLEGAIASINEKFARDDAPAAPAPPSPPKPSLLEIFNSLVSQLEPVVAEIQDTATVDVNVEVSSANVVAATQKLVPILQSTLAEVEVVAANPENFILNHETVGPVVGTVVQTVTLALSTAVGAVGTAEGALMPVVAEIGVLLNGTVALVVTKIVPSTLAVVAEKAKAVLMQIYFLNIAAIADTLGLKPPMS